MKQPWFLFILVLVLGLYAAPALADPVGDMIAKNLCQSKTATLTLGNRDTVYYDNTEEFSGTYSFTDENKASVSTMFYKSRSRTYCKKTTRPYYGPDETPPPGEVEIWFIVKRCNTLEPSAPNAGLF